MDNIIENLIGQRPSTVVWEIFVQDNLVVKFIRCVIFSWVSYTHENILPSNFVHTERFLPTLHFFGDLRCSY